jgi:hypothetical protein
VASSRLLRLAGTLGGLLLLFGGGSGVVPEGRCSATTITRTREQWARRTGRVDRERLNEMAWPATDHQLVRRCGPTGFVEISARCRDGDA